ncbi:MAG: hypothetical protein KGO51_15510 [Alphaproteobacteria bacterium]|nr:hypothetical protein [Alphaproteobacteria bacterium]
MFLGDDRGARHINPGRSRHANAAVDKTANLSPYGLKREPQGLRYGVDADGAAQLVRDRLAGIPVSLVKLEVVAQGSLIRLDDGGEDQRQDKIAAAAADVRRVDEELERNKRRTPINWRLRRGCART